MKKLIVTLITRLKTRLWGNIRPRKTSQLLLILRDNLPGGLPARGSLYCCMRTGELHQEGVISRIECQKLLQFLSNSLLGYATIIKLLRETGELLPIDYTTEDCQTIRKDWLTKQSALLSEAGL